MVWDVDGRVEYCCCCWCLLWACCWLRVGGEGRGGVEGGRRAKKKVAVGRVDGMTTARSAACHVRMAAHTSHRLLVAALQLGGLEDLNGLFDLGVQRSGVLKQVQELGNLHALQ